MTTALWKRNAIGAAVTVVALAVFIGFYLYPQWSAYRQTVTPAHMVAASQSAQIDGVTWRVTGVRHLTPNAGFGLAPPAKTVLAVVSVERIGAGPGSSCIGVLTDGTRRWRAQVVGVYTLPTPDGVSGDCSKPGPLQFTFVLPQDAVPTAVDVTTYSGQIMVRLEL